LPGFLSPSGRAIPHPAMPRTACAPGIADGIRYRADIYVPARKAAAAAAMQRLPIAMPARHHTKNGGSIP